MSTLAVLFFFPALFCESASVRHSQNSDRVLPLADDEIAERWNAFASARPQGDYCLDFTITHLPRAGAETLYDGTLWGTQIGGDIVMRIIIKKRGEAKTADFLLRAGLRGSAVYKLESGKLVKLPEADFFKPLYDGLVYAPFDLLAPYRFWKDFEYAGPGRIGQAVHYFTVKAPAELAKERADCAAVRIALAREFNSPVQTELLGVNNAPVKTLSLSSIKKVNGLWMVKKLDLRDENTRDKDKLLFTRAALGITLENADEIFNPALIENSSGKTPAKPITEEL